MNPYLGRLTSGAPDLEGEKTEKRNRKRKKKKVIKGTGRKKKKKKRKHCHNVGLQFVTDILGQDGCQSSNQR